MRQMHINFTRLVAPGNDPRVVERAQSARREHRGREIEIEWPAVFGRRLAVLALIFVVWGVGIEARLVYLQLFKAEALRDVARNQQEDHVIIPAERGDIVDRHGNTLAMSVQGFALEAARRLIADPEADAARVCAVLDRCTAAERRAMAQLMRMPGPRASKYVFLRRAITGDEARRVANLNHQGLRTVDVSHRFYPNGTTGAHVLGFVNVDNKGQTGIELAQETRVAGKPGRKIAQVTGDRSRTRLSTRVLSVPTTGSTVQLTIDRALQFIAERELQKAIEEHGAKGGSVVIMDPWTGDVLALANAPTFDPNRVGDYAPTSRQNRAALHIYEPGSTFKIVTAAAALEEGKMRPSNMIDVSAGYIQFGARRIHDVHRYGPLSFTDVIVKSSNVGAIKVGLALGPEVISRYVSRFGFGEVNARDIPHQRVGLVDRKMSAFGPSALASVSMGYQIGVTPLQMAAAMSTIANGGELVAPRLVRAIVGSTGQTEVPRRVVRRTISADVAAELTGILEQVVERGTATTARIEGYTIAGKTGTARKAEGGRYTDEYNASFVGFLPSRQPRVTILAVVDAPRRKGFYGGVVAAPLFKNVAEATLRYLGIPPNVNPAPAVLVARAPAPVPARPIAVRSVAPLEPLVSLASREGVVPDVRGLSAREAVLALARVGVAARVNGHGFVVDQTLAPGDAVGYGRICTLSLKRDLIPVGGEAGTQP